MPKLSDNALPSYRRHRASGLAVVTLSGQDVYLGAYGTPDSRTKYNRLIAEWLAAGRKLRVDPRAITVMEIVIGYQKHAAAYYPSNEPKSIDMAVAPLLKLYGRTEAITLGPLAMQAVLAEMVTRGWCRSFCNQQLGRLKRMFKWAARQELVPVELYERLRIAQGLGKGRSAARESERVKAVPEHIINATLPYLGRRVRAMVELQLASGARPAEICNLRAGDIDTTGEVWIATLGKHKNAHHGHERMLYFGPRAQAVLKPFLKLDTTAYLFDPRESERERLEMIHAARITPPFCGNRPGSNRVRKPKREPGDHYEEAAYRRAIHRACDRADTWLKGGAVIGNDDRLIPRWSPHRLRHSRATELRKRFGIEAAQCILGHRNLSTAEIYAEKNAEAAMKIMSQVG